MKSGLFYKIIPALRAMDTYLPMPSWNADLLFAAGAFEYMVLAAFRKPELKLAPVLRHIKTHPHISLIFLIPLSYIL